MGKLRPQLGLLLSDILQHGLTRRREQARDASRVPFACGRVHLASSSGLSAKNCPTSTCDILGRRARHAAGSYIAYLPADMLIRPAWRPRVVTGRLLCSVGAEPKRRRLSSSSIRELVRLARPELALLSAGGAALVIGTGTQLAIPVGFGRLGYEKSCLSYVNASANVYSDSLI